MKGEGKEREREKKHWEGRDWKKGRSKWEAFGKGRMRDGKQECAGGKEVERYAARKLDGEVLLRSPSTLVPSCPESNKASVTKKRTKKKHHLHFK